MSQFIVDSASLRDLATTLQNLSEGLGTINTAAPDYTPYLGGTALADEVLNFNHKWQYGVKRVSAEITGMVVRLDDAAKAYEAVDRQAGQGHTNPVGKPPTGGPGGHHKVKMYPGGNKDGRIPTVPHPGTGSGTTKVGGGGKGSGQPGNGGSHAPITVHSNLLTSDQRTFVAKLSALTGLSPRVVGAWCLAEESSGYAKERQAEHNNDWLNIGYDDSGRVGSSYGSVWSNPTSAAEQSAKFLEGKWDGADPSIQHILDSAGKSDDAQITAIYQSKWASSHYNNGALLHSTYDALSGLTVSKG